jgi:hypothetical protein
VTSTATGIAPRLAAVRARIVAACERAGRDPASVTLIGVSKTHPAQAVVEAYGEGLNDFGENRVQEGVPKVEEVRRLLGGRPMPGFHLIGHLQTNKVRAALGAFSLIQSVDSPRLLAVIARNAEGMARVLIEVNVSGEASKFGVAPGDLPALLLHARSRTGIEVEGLMTVAPVATDPEEVRPVFRQLRALAHGHGLSTLSMGMSDDFEVAIEEGATHVRIGRAIFGERQP